jgi:hypothetical protein
MIQPQSHGGTEHLEWSLRAPQRGHSERCPAPTTLCLCASVVDR